MIDVTAPEFEDAVAMTVRSIPWGEVMTYGEVATDAGYPGAARAVGNVLRTTALDIPWWRVVGSGGRITSRSIRQAELLAQEGWIVRSGRLRRSPER